MNIAVSSNGHRSGRRRIAVVGSGISGAAAAWALNGTADVTLFEADGAAGGHTATVDVDYDGRHDRGRYRLHRLQRAQLSRSHGAVCASRRRARTQATWAFRCRSTAAGSNGAAPTVRSIFAQKRNFFSPSFLWMLREILRFNRQCVEDRDAGQLAHRSIGDYLEHRKFSHGFRDNYLIPMAAAIWSTPRIKMLDYPAAAFVSFFENHRLIHNERPAWRTVTGGSRSYLRETAASRSAGASGLARR